MSGNLDRLARHRHLTDRALAPTQARRAEQRGLAPVRVERRARGELLGVLVVLEDRASVRARELHRPANDRGEDGVEVERRADRAPDIAEGRELRDRAGELLRPRLQLGQQAGVLDRDHRLVGEGREERNLVASEPAGFAASYRDRPNHLVAMKQRHDSPASVTTRAGTVPPAFVPSGIVLVVDDVDRCPIANGLRVQALGADRPWEGCPREGVDRLVRVLHRGKLDLIARDPSHRARVGSQQADGAGHDRVEHRSDVRLRAADDTQDVAGGGLCVQRRGQLAVARLQLGEQADVLDGDHRLVGEGLDELYLRITVGAEFEP